MSSLGAIDPAAAAMFQAAFDEAVSVGDRGETDVIQKMVLPKLGYRGLSFTRLCWAFDVALAIVYPLVEARAGVAFAKERAVKERRPRDVITDHLKMMYVSGESGEPSVETTGIIEDIVRQQVIEILKNCTELAARRGSRSITINDLIFQIRDDAPKVSRLRTFLSWKDVRKNVKDSDDKGGEADLGAGEDPVGGVVAGGPVDDTAKKNKKAKVGLPWEPASFFPAEVPEREDEEDEEEEEMNHITLQRLRKADERTKAMTKEEYVTWSEYRQASFTYRKGKRFREWAGFGIVTDSKPSDDIVDILGFLTFEMVQTLTEEALKIKENEDQHRERTGENAGKKRKLPGGIGGGGLFDPPSEGRTPVEPRHIQEAFRRLQQRPKKARAMLNGTRLQQRTTLKLI
ncbi:transcription initiation factor IID, 18kD subunit-domain-containing protein [Chaetomium sp. MPI-SDFR-AT-0129]|nr:transcription initiation factor IID, 18kD subunit-domain-containing protein [Chaetomium sp. MPI-SDFR-AT-0129]